MQSSTDPWLPKYCSVATTLKAPDPGGAAPPWNLSFTCPFALQAPWLPAHCVLTRCASCHPCLHTADSPWPGPRWLGRVGGAAGPWVLARWEPDGFYYRAQIKAAPELERQGALVVGFEVPLVSDPKPPAQQWSVVLQEEVIQLSSPVEQSLQPGDKVLAPWEPEQVQYGPGTVLSGLKKKKHHRASKKKEITVHFWNGKTAKVPADRVRGIPSAVWKKAVERLQMLHTSECHSPPLWAPCCPRLGPNTGCATHGCPVDMSFLCPPCCSQICGQLLCQGHLHSCPLVGPTCWPLTRTSEFTAREVPEPELKPTAQFLPLEGPKEAAAVFTQDESPSPSSSSSCEENSEDALEMGLLQRQMVSSTVNTDPILPEPPPRQSSPPKPAWRYWRRNGPEPPPGKPGS
uniref:cDNA sequence BC051019 n=1 Tax=Nannospalax galili TaxID=1026970 RepID=A0A8C6WBK7_NANGA